MNDRGQRPQFLLGRAAAGGIAGRRDEGVEMRRHDLAEYVFLRRKVMIDQRLGRFAGLGEVGHRGAVEAVAGVKPRRRRKDRLAALVVIGRLRSSHRFTVTPARAGVQSLSPAQERRR
jgi:hypothetical protein